MTPLIITPKTKIYDLLETYPQLEAVLISKAPEFKRLKNPLLRNTIARVTTIAQAATIGSLAVDALVNELRAQVGQDCITAVGNTGATEETSTTYNTKQPTWFSPGDIQETINAGILLDNGEQPIHEVLSKLRKLEDDDILQVIAPFIPVPLIDKATSLGYEHWLQQETGGKWNIYFKRNLQDTNEEATADDTP